MEQKQGNFFDQKTIIAVVLTGVVFLGWQKYLTSKYPTYGKPAAKAEAVETAAAPKEASTTNEETKGTVPTTSADQKVVAGATVGNADKPEQTVAIDTDLYSFQVSSRGLGVKDLILKKYTDREHQQIRLARAERSNLFEMRINGEPVHFEVQASEADGAKVLTGLAQIGSMTVKRVLTFSSQYFLTSRIEIQNPTQEFKQFEIQIPEKRVESGGGSFLSPSLDFQEVVLKNSEKDERLNLSTSKEDVTKSLGLQTSFGVSSHYFMTAYSNTSDISPEVSVDYKHKDTDFLAVGTYKIASPQASMVFEGTGYFGPKDLKIIDNAPASLKGDFSHFVNFGFFGSIGKILLKTLQFFYQYTIPNWGLAIIFLTLLVRLLVLPFNIASYKSMRKMTKIQPMIAALRERYKADPQTLNTEMMKLMKDQKVNPLGGCIPMLLQMPVFFALYQVLGQSIELYQAPFFGWIHDLSLKDPFFVTPVLMGLAMWYNQKITPNTMDPAQAKMMQFLPIVFSVMMIALPSGLTLYIFVSTLFGIIQQQMFMKDRSTTAKA